MDKSFENNLVKKKINIISPQKLNTKTQNKKILKKRDKIDLIKKVIEMCRDISNLNIPLKITSENEKKIFVYDKNKKTKITLSYSDTLNPKVFPWFLMKFSNLSPFEAFTEYKQIVSNDFLFNKIILKKSFKAKILKKEVNSKEANKNNALPVTLSVIYSNTNDNQKLEVFKAEDGLFCYCKKPFMEGDFMVGKIKLILYFRLLL